MNSFRGHVQPETNVFTCLKKWDSCNFSHQNSGNVWDTYLLYPWHCLIIYCRTICENISEFWSSMVWMQMESHRDLDILYVQHVHIHIYLYIYIYVNIYMYIYILCIYIYIYRYCRVLRIPSSRSFQFQAAQQLDPGLEPPHGVCQGPNGLVGKSWHKKTRHSTIV